MIDTEISKRIESKAQKHSKYYLQVERLEEAGKYLAEEHNQHFVNGKVQLAYAEAVRGQKHWHDRNRCSRRHSEGRRVSSETWNKNNPERTGTLSLHRPCFPEAKKAKVLAEIQTTANLLDLKLNISDATGAIIKQYIAVEMGAHIASLHCKLSTIFEKLEKCIKSTSNKPTPNSGVFDPHMTAFEPI